MDTFPIAADEHYGWRTGSTESGEQAILSAYQDLFFDPAGRFLRLVYHCDWHDYSPSHEVAFNDRSERLLVANVPIRVQEFEASESAFLRRMPKNFQASVNDPANSEVDRAFIDQWIQEGQFEFQFNGNFWMNADGTVESS